MVTVLQLATLAAVALILLRVGDLRRRLDALDPLRRGATKHREGSEPARPAAPAPPPREAPPAPAAPPARAVGMFDLRIPRDPGTARPAEAARSMEAARAAEAAPGAPGRPRVDLELGFGRRWAALLGGGLVVLGLVLLLRHSIEQGYLPPAVRLLGSALLSLALCAAAELFRRRGTFEAAAAAAGLARRAADVPSVLLGTGLGGLFASAYAAQAVYGLLDVGPAFAAMAAAALAGVGAAFAYGPALAVLGFLAAEGVPPLLGSAGGAPVAACAALVGVAGYGAAHVGGWRRLENPAGLVLLLWAVLLGSEPPLVQALVGVPAGGAALAFTALRLRPRAAWTDWQPSAGCCVALLLAAGQGLALAFGAAGRAEADAVAALALAFALLLAAFGFAATAARARPVAPALAAAVAGAVAVDAARVAAGTAGAGPGQVGWVLAAASLAGLAAAALALHRGSRRSPLTGLVGAASAAGLMAAADLAVHRLGGLGGPALAGFAALQGAALLAAAWPRRGAVPPARQFATAAAGSAGVALLGLAPVLAGLGDGPLLALVLALAAAGGAALAVLWRSSLFAAMAGAAAVPVLLGCGSGLLRDAALPDVVGAAALWPFLLDTLLPGLALAGGAALLHRRIGAAAVREADRCWLGLVGLPAPAPRPGRAVSLVLADAAAGGLLSAAGVGLARFAAYGAPFAPPSVPADLGLAGALALGGALAASRLWRAAPHPALREAGWWLVLVATLLAAAALILNPFVAGAPVGPLPGLNLLALAYLLPAAAAARLAHGLAAPGPPEAALLRGAAAALAVVGAVAYGTFSVSQLFQGSVLTLGGITEAELWCYTALWLLSAAALMLRGLRRPSRATRLAALGIVAGTAAKVAFVDLADLTGAARAASVLALGLALLGVGMAYQRLAGVEGRP